MTKPSRPSPYPIVGGLVFGVALAVCTALIRGNADHAFHIGFFGAFAFGFAIHRFTKTAESTTLLDMDGRAAGFEADEPVVHYGLANHFKGTFAFDFVLRRELAAAEAGAVRPA